MIRTYKLTIKVTTTFPLTVVMSKILELFFDVAIIEAEEI